jgi:RimJ/RimL family protein N-acetyltransferase
MRRHVRFECTCDTFQPDASHSVRWLDWERDYDLASSIWPDECPLARETWLEARELGYRYCGVVVRRRVGGDRLLAIAAVWRYSETAWEAAAVRTQPDARRRGYAKAAVSFVTAHILDSGRRATCTTGADNVAMQRTAESVGFIRID